MVTGVPPDSGAPPPGDCGAESMAREDPAIHVVESCRISRPPVWKHGLTMHIRRAADPAFGPCECGRSTSTDSGCMPPGSAGRWKGMAAWRAGPISRCRATSSTISPFALPGAALLSMSTADHPGLYGHVRYRLPELAAVGVSGAPVAQKAGC